MSRKVIITCDKLFDRIIVLVSLLFFLICAYAMYDAAMVYYNANDTSVLKYKPDLTNPEVLKEISKDAIAWITVLYGHHMDYGAMFGALDEFKKQDYFDSHRTGRLITVGGKAYDIRFFASAVVLATDELVFHPNDATPEALLAMLSGSAIVYEPPETQDDLQLIALSTCQDADTLDRMVVFGVMKESF